MPYSYFIINNSTRKWYGTWRSRHVSFTHIQSKELIFVCNMMNWFGLDLQRHIKPITKYINNKHVIHDNFKLVYKAGRTLLSVLVEILNYIQDEQINGKCPSRTIMWICICKNSDICVKNLLKLKKKNFNFFQKNFKYFKCIWIYKSYLVCFLLSFTVDCVDGADCIRFGCSWAKWWWTRT